MQSAKNLKHLLMIRTKRFFDCRIIIIILLLLLLLFYFTYLIYWLICLYWLVEWLLFFLHLLNHWKVQAIGTANKCS